MTMASSYHKISFEIVLSFFGVDFRHDTWLQVYTKTKQ